MKLSLLIEHSRASLHRLFLDRWLQLSRREWQPDVDAASFFVAPAGGGHECYKARFVAQREALASGRSDAWDVSLLCQVITRSEWSSLTRQRRQRAEEDAVVERLREARNLHAHTVPSQLTPETFEKLWAEVSACLAELGEDDANLLKLKEGP
jgi:hypothetical protein